MSIGPEGGVFTNEREADYQTFRLNLLGLFQDLEYARGQEVEERVAKSIDELRTEHPDFHNQFVAEHTKQQLSMKE